MKKLLAICLLIIPFIVQGHFCRKISNGSSVCLIDTTAITLNHAEFRVFGYAKYNKPIGFALEAKLNGKYIIPKGTPMLIKLGNGEIKEVGCLKEAETTKEKGQYLYFDYTWPQYELNDTLISLIKEHGIQKIRIEVENDFKDFDITVGQSKEIIECLDYVASDISKRKTLYDDF